MDRPVTMHGSHPALRRARQGMGKGQLYPLMQPWGVREGFPEEGAFPCRLQVGDGRRFQEMEEVEGGSRQGGHTQEPQECEGAEQNGETTPVCGRPPWEWHKTRLAFLTKDTGEELLFSPEGNREP